MGIVWTTDKNARRCLLIDSKLDGALSEVELEELDRLQAEMLAWRNEVAPLPLDRLRALRDVVARLLS